MTQPSTSDIAPRPIPAIGLFGRSSAAQAKVPDLPASERALERAKAA